MSDIKAEIETAEMNAMALLHNEMRADGKTPPTAPVVETKPDVKPDVKTEAPQVIPPVVAKNDDVDAGVIEIANHGDTKVDAPKASRRLLDIQRKEQEIKRRERELEEREARFKAPVVEKNDERAPLTVEQIRRIALSNPRALLDLAGIDEGYISAFSATGAPPPQHHQRLIQEQIDARLAQIEAETQRRVQEFEERQLKQQAERVNQDFIMRVTEDLRTPALADKFELFIADQGERVPQLILQAIRDDYDDQVAAGELEPRVMTVEEAAQLFEDELQERADRLLKTKKLSSRAQAAVVKDVKEGKGPGPLLNGQKQDDDASDERWMTLLERERALDTHNAGAHQGAVGNGMQTPNVAPKQSVSDTTKEDLIEKELIERASKELMQMFR